MTDNRHPSNSQKDDARPSNKRKLVCVIVETDDVRKTYEIEFQSSEQADLDTISICLKKKSKYLASKLEDPLYVSTFEKPSHFFEGKWTAIGDDSPVKDRSEVKLNISAVRDLNALSRSLSLSDCESLNVSAGKIL